MYTNHNARNKMCKEAVNLEWSDDWTLPEHFLEPDTFFAVNPSLNSHEGY